MSVALVEAFQPTEEKTESPTSTENTAPDMQKPLRLLAEAATDRGEIQEGSRGPLKAAHALKPNDLKWKDKDGWRETTGARPISHFLLNHAC